MQPRNYRSFIKYNWTIGRISTEEARRMITELDAQENRLISIKHLTLVINRRRYEISKSINSQARSGED